MGGFAELEGATDVAAISNGSHAYAVAASRTDDGVQIINVTNPALPVPTASITHNSTYPELGGASAVETIVINNASYALVASTVDDGVQIINVTNPALPVPTASITHNSTYPELDGASGIATVTINSRHYALVTAYVDDGVQIIDITNPASPVATADITDGEDGFDTLDGALGIATAAIGSRTYAIVAANADNGTQIIDISNPASPSPVAEAKHGQNGFAVLEGASGVATAAIGSRTYAIVAANASHGVQVMDISNPSSPVATAAIVNGSGGFDMLGNASGVTMATYADQFYAIVASVGSDGLQFINMTDPASPSYAAAAPDMPVPLDRLDGASGVMTFSNATHTHALVASSGDSSVHIVDITSPSFPVGTATIVDGSGGFDSLGGAHGITNVTNSTHTFALVTGYADDSVTIIDVTDPVYPDHAAVISNDNTVELEGPRGITTAKIGDNTYALVAAQKDDGVQIINITDPASPDSVAAIADGSGYTFDGPFDVEAVMISSRTYALVTNYDGDSVQIIEISRSMYPSPIATIEDGKGGFTTLDGATDIEILHQGAKFYALVAAEEDDGIQIINITNPYEPSAVASVIDNSTLVLDGAHGITTVGNSTHTFALVAANVDNGVQIIDITDITSPVMVSNASDGARGFAELDGARHIAGVTVANNTYALVTAYDDDGLQVIDLNRLHFVATPSAPVDDDDYGGGGCADCVPPTLGIDENGKRMVTDGFVYNGLSVDVERFYTPYPMITTEIGRDNVASFKIYENQGPQNIAHFSFAFGMAEGQIISESRAMIELDISHDGTRTVTVTDEYDVFGNVTVNVADSMPCGASGAECLGVDIHHTFVDHLEFDIVGTNVWDRSRNGWQNYYNHGIDITGESLNPPETREIAGTEKGEGLIQVTRVEKYGDIWVADDGRTFDRNDAGSFRQINIEFERFQDTGEAKTRLHSGFAAKVDSESDRAESVMIALCSACADESYEEIDDTNRVPAHLQERAQAIWEALMEKARQSQE